MGREGDVRMLELMEWLESVDSIDFWVFDVWPVAAIINFSISHPCLVVLRSECQKSPRQQDREPCCPMWEPRAVPDHAGMPRLQASSS